MEFTILNATSITCLELSMPCQANCNFLSCYCNCLYVSAMGHKSFSAFFGCQVSNPFDVAGLNLQVWLEMGDLYPLQRIYYLELRQQETSNH